MSETPSPIVSSEDDTLILVDSEDRELGFASKRECHDGDGLLHRAFSVFLFDSDGRMLIQRRAAGKRLWPLHWSNACCSHPRRGESLPTSVRRRTQEELGLDVAVDFVFRFTYRAAYGNMGSENEFCHVFIGRADRDPTINANEIAAWKYVDVPALDGHLIAEPTRYTPWFKLEWRTLRTTHWDMVRRLLPF